MSPLKYNGQVHVEYKMITLIAGHKWINVLLKDMFKNIYFCLKTNTLHN